MHQRPRGFWRDENAMTTVEYALLLALIALAVIAAWVGFGGSMRTSVEASGGRFEGSDPAPHAGG
jgi:Flp pilus assembly pilin Flp